MSNVEHTHGAAAFLIQALDLDDAPGAIAPEIAEIKRDANAAIYTIQLESSIGPAAFLIYVYELDATDDQAQTGRQLFEAGLATLEAAAQRNAPGPRIVAHALTDAEGFILATTPATYRALSGEETTEAIEASAADLLPIEESAQTRRAAADELLRLLRAADAEAARWLGAIRAAGQVEPAVEGRERAETLLFNEEETALALFLLDERSIQHLLQVLNLVLTAASHQAKGALGIAPDRGHTEREPRER